MLDTESDEAGNSRSHSVYSGGHSVYATELKGFAAPLGEFHFRFRTEMRREIGSIKLESYGNRIHCLDRVRANLEAVL
jgi:hypothetical protein